MVHDRQASIQCIADRLGISQERVCIVLTKKLSINAVLARQDPNFLPQNRKLQINMSSVTLRCIFTDRESFVSRFVFRNEDWVHHYKSDVTQHAIRLMHHSSPPQNKVRVIPSRKRGVARFLGQVEVMSVFTAFQRVRQ